MGRESPAADYRVGVPAGDADSGDPRPLVSSFAPKLVLTPIVMLINYCLLVGATEPYDQIPADCGDYCYDIMLARQDELACTGDFQNDPLWGEDLEKCRAKLRREDRPVAGDGDT